MTRDDGPPEDEVPGAERHVPDERARAAEPNVLDTDAHAGRTWPGAPDQHRARGTQSDVQDEYTPPEDLIAEFSRQCTRDVTEAVCRYAARLLSGARKVSATDYHAQELAQDAVDDTLEGRAPWDPAARPLKRHLYNVVKRKISANRERAERLPHVSFDVVSAEGHSSLRDELERAMRARRPDERAAEYARGVTSELRQRASGDADVLALIQAKADERTSRADAMEVTGFSEQRYRAALRRLNRIADELGIELHLTRNGKGRT